MSPNIPKPTLARFISAVLIKLTLHLRNDLDAIKREHDSNQARKLILENEIRHLQETITCNLTELPRINNKKLVVRETLWKDVISLDHVLVNLMRLTHDASTKGLKSHKSSRHNRHRKKIFKCDIGECKSVFTISSDLLVHQRRHRGEKPFKCQKRCEKTFVTRRERSDHYLTHTGERPFQCEQCDNRFSLRRNLKAHNRTHSGEKPYECPKCSKRFAWIQCHKKHVVNCSPY